MTCPCCNMQLPAGLQFCPNCKTQFAPLNQSVPVPPMAFAAPVAPAQDEEFNPRLLKFYRKCYRVYRLIPIISTLVTMLLSFLAGIIIAIASEEPIFIIISVFGPVVAVLNFFVISVMISEKIARTDATIQMLELYRKQLKGEKI